MNALDVVALQYITYKQNKFYSLKLSCRDRDDTFNEKRNTTYLKWNEMHLQMNIIQIYEQYILLMSLYIKICAKNWTCNRVLCHSLTVFLSLCSLYRVYWEVTLDTICYVWISSIAAWIQCIMYKGDIFGLRVCIKLYKTIEIFEWNWNIEKTSNMALLSAVYCIQVYVVRTMLGQYTFSLAFLVVRTLGHSCEHSLVHVNWIADSYFIWFILFFKFNPLFRWSVCVSNDISFYRFIQQREKVRTKRNRHFFVFLFVVILLLLALNRSLFISFHCIYIFFILFRCNFYFNSFCFDSFLGNGLFVAELLNPMFFRLLPFSMLSPKLEVLLDFFLFMILF